MSQVLHAKILEFESAHVGYMEVVSGGEGANINVHTTITYEIDGIRYGYRAPDFEMKTIDDCLPSLKEQIALDELMEDIGCDMFANHEDIPVPICKGEDENDAKYLCICEFMQRPGIYDNGDETLESLKKLAKSRFTVEVEA